MNIEVEGVSIPATDSKSLSNYCFVLSKFLRAYQLKIDQLSTYSRLVTYPSKWIIRNETKVRTRINFYQAEKISFLKDENFSEMQYNVQAIDQRLENIRVLVEFRVNKFNEIVHAIKVPGTAVQCHKYRQRRQTRKNTVLSYTCNRQTKLMSSSIRKNENCNAFQEFFHRIFFFIPTASCLFKRNNCFINGNRLHWRLNFA